MSYDEATDFTPEDRGRYRPADVDGFTADEIEAKILAALSDSDGHNDGRAFRTLPRIKEHAGLSKGSDISEIISSMIVDEKIARHENGDFTCYFLFNEKPKRYWRNGDGTVGAEFPEEDEPHPFAAQIGKVAEPAAYQEPVMNVRTGNYGRAPIEINPDDLERAIAKHGKQSLAAKDLSLGESTLYSKIKAQPQLQAAYDRGLKLYQEANAMPEKTEKQEKTMSTATAPAMAETETKHAHAPKGINWSVELFTDAYERGEAIGDLAKRLGVSYPAVAQQLKKHEDYADAFNGRAAAPADQSVSRQSTATAEAKMNDTTETIDLQVVEELAWLGRTIPKAAEFLCVNYYTFNDHVKGKRKRQDIKDAWERGLVRRKKALENLSDELVAAESIENASERHDREIAEVAGIETETTNTDLTKDPQSPRSSIVMELGIDEAAEKENRTSQAEDSSDITNDVDENIPGSGMIPAFEGQVERFPQVDPFSEPARNEPFRSIKIREIKATPINEYPNADRPTSTLSEIIKIQREVAAELDAAIQPVSSKLIPFGNTGAMMVGFEGNYFDLSKEERKFLETMADQFDCYGKPVPCKRTALQRIADWLATI